MIDDSFARSSHSHSPRQFINRSIKSCLAQTYLLPEDRKNQLLIMKNSDFNYLPALFGRLDKSMCRIILLTDLSVFQLVRLTTMNN